VLRFWREDTTPALRDSQIQAFWDQEDSDGRTMREVMLTPDESDDMEQMEPQSAFQAESG